MLNPVRPLLRSQTLRSLALCALFAAPGCDSGAVDPGLTQDGTANPDLGEDVAGDTSADDTAVADSAVQDSAPDTVADATVTDTAPDTTTDTAVDTTAPDTSDTADTTVEDTTADTSPDTTADTTTDSGEIELPTVRPPITTTSSTFVGDWDMEFGKETTKCVVKRLDNADALWVSQIRTVMSAGSHHLIIYKSDETQEKTTPFNCDPFVQTLKGSTFPLMITQIREETLTFPNGVAFKFEPHQMIRLEAHYLNYFPDTTITAHADVHFDGIAAADVVAEANLLFYGNPDLAIPEGEYQTPWRWISVLPNTHLFAITGHTHAFGTNVEIATSSGVDDPGTSIYPGDVPFTWSEPPVEQFDPAMVFDGSQGFRYRCSWDNTSGGELDFGESATKEMCFLWAYYYPSQGYRLCVSPGSIGNGVAGDEVCCPGHWVCDYIQQFL